jgi:hypothetical protein
LSASIVRPDFIEPLEIRDYKCEETAIELEALEELFGKERELSK